MNRDQFETLVKATEKYADEHPKMYIARLIGLVLLGNGYLIGVALLTMGLFAGLIWLIVYGGAKGALIYLLLKKGGILLLIPAFAVVRAFWAILTLREEPPPGHEIHRKDYPALFKFIDELSDALKAPRIHHVLVNPEFNASVVQLPRFGLFLGHRNYVVLGLPLMMGLSHEQFQAVLAHELGHLSGQHSKFDAWIYSINHSLQLVQEKVDMAGFLFRVFYNWYIPFFDACSFPLMRRREYEADSISVELVGKETTARALIVTEVKAAFLDKKFWNWVDTFSKTRPDPPSGLFDAMSFLLKRGMDDAEAQKYLTEALRVRTFYSDSHPCLIDRLRAIGISPDKIDWNADMPASAADFYLNFAKSELKTKVNEEWREDWKDTWKERYEEHRKLASELEALEARSDRDSWDDHTLYRYARLTGLVKDDDAALPVLEALMRQNPDYPPALYAMGCILLEKEQVEGIRFIESAIELDRSYTNSGCATICSYFRSQGDNAAMKSYMQRVDEYNAAYDLAMEKACELSEKDPFEAPAPDVLDEAKRKALCADLEKFPGLERVYVVRKPVEAMPEVNFYIIAFQRKTRLIEDRLEEAMKLGDAILPEILKRFEDELKGTPNAMLLPHMPESAKLFKALEGIEGAQVYPGEKVIKTHWLGSLGDRLRRSA